VKNGLKVTFLIGAGASIPAGMPTTTELTDKILSGSEYEWVNPSEEFRPSNTGSSSGGEVDRVKNYLKTLKGELDQYYSKKKVVNYEDLYSCALTVERCVSAQLHDRPHVRALVDRLSPKLVGLGATNDQEIKDLSERAVEYMRCVVAKSLRNHGRSFAHLDVLLGASNSERVCELDIATLNHDLLIEECLTQNGIAYADGFEGQRCEDRQWNPETFKCEDCKTRLLKLHGSIDWYQCFTSDPQRRYRYFAVPFDRPLEPKRKNGTDWALTGASYSPRMLIGNENKVQQYTRSLFIELHCRFYNALRRSDLIVVTGYGFGDDGINYQLLSQVPTNQYLRYIVIHPRPDGILDRSKYGTKVDLRTLKSSGRLASIQKGIEETSWGEVLKAYESMH